MLEIELLRQIIAFEMLSVASYSDMKRREVSDMVWIIFGVAGVLLYLFEPLDIVTILYLVIGIAIGLTGFFTKFFGQADCLALIAVTITMPALDRFPVGVIISVATPILASIFSLCSNVGYNLSDLLQGRLFWGIRDRPHRKAFAFLVLHRRRKHEKFVFKAQYGDKFVFHLRPKANEFAEDFEGYVLSALPLIPFMLVSTILILLL